MIVRQIPVGRMQNFTYVASDEGTRECVVIDPSWDLGRVFEALEGLRPAYIVNTHGHFDHVEGNAEVARRTGARVVQHEESGLPHDVSVSGGGSVRFGSSSLRVLHTPGHSRDSVCLVGGGAVFSGDTLFVGSCGRTDLPGGSAEDLYDSLYRGMAALDGALVVYPGHDYGPSPTSTMGAERRSNPVLQARGRAEFLAMLGG